MVVVVEPRHVNVFRLDSRTGEQYTFNFQIEGQSKCILVDTHDDNGMSYSPNWRMDFTSARSELTLSYEAFEKAGSGDACQWSGDDLDHASRIAGTITLPVSSINDGGSTPWSFSSDIPDDLYCVLAGEGSLYKYASQTTVRPPALPMSADDRWMRMTVMVTDDDRDGD